MDLSVPSPRLLKKMQSFPKRSFMHLQADSLEASGHVSFLYSNNPHAVGVLRATPFRFTHAFTIGFSVHCLSSTSYVTKNWFYWPCTRARDGLCRSTWQLSLTLSPFFFVPLFFLFDLLCAFYWPFLPQGMLSLLYTHSHSCLHSVCVQVYERVLATEREICTARAYTQPLLQKAHFIYIILKAFSVEIAITSCYKWRKAAKSSLKLCQLSQRTSKSRSFAFW